ncbi:ferritin-like domain-containing protein [Halobacillus naozhouensis]|uniref:Ferritin-like domain-containing protein n=1 Tax=Halobacillus naozhouensis TaxID=554880 RepID=A0ABY8J2J3_9BACI|nr:ferritin-like domain-containing protein [Halobacillus naozhouensis]WFT76282.1 ferritin-like domain-containing protein [Halobacillus naozhouensis]
MYQNQYYNPYGNYRTPYDAPLIRDIKQAIDGEYSAVACYSQLIEIAPKKEEKQQIREILQDEKDHLETFKKIYTILTGRQPVPQIIEECPNAYREGITAAFKDEQETVDFYLEIADKAHDVFIKESFRRASADEQNHAVWFLYFIGSP